MVTILTDSSEEEGVGGQTNVASAANRDSESSDDRSISVVDSERLKNKAATPKGIIMYSNYASGGSEVYGSGLCVVCYSCSMKK